jgi:hypothetical protein
MSRSLDNDYGTTRGPNAPSSHKLALFVGDPMVPLTDGGGVECDSVNHPGYGRVTVSPGDWLAAVDGRKDLAAPKQLPATTGEWDPEPTHWGLFDGDDNTTLWDCGPLTEPLQVTGAGSGPLVSVRVYYDDAVTEPEE